MDYDEPTVRRFMTAATYADRYRSRNHRHELQDPHYDDYGPEENDWEHQREFEDAYGPELHHYGGYGDALDPDEHFDNRDPALGHTYPDMVGGPPSGSVAIQPPGHGGPGDARIVYDEDTGLGYDAIARPGPHGGGWDVLKELPGHKDKQPAKRTAGERMPWSAVDPRDYGPGFHRCENCGYEDEEGEPDCPSCGYNDDRDHLRHHHGGRGKVAAPAAHQRGPHWQPTVDALREIGGRYRDQPVTLKDGRQTNIYLDPKHVFSSNKHMNNLSQAMLEHAQALGIDYNAVGGPTMGADVISHGMVAHHPNPDMGWFTVRDKPKSDHGLGKWIEGTEIGPNHKVILTDDVADTGKSLVDAYHKVRESGAQVTAVMPVVERGDKTRAQFEQLGVPYHPLCNYQDLGIDTLSQEPPPASPSRVEESEPGW